MKISTSVGNEERTPLKNALDLQRVFDVCYFMKEALPISESFGMKLDNLKNEIKGYLKRDMAFDEFPESSLFILPKKKEGDGSHYSLPQDIIVLKDKDISNENFKELVLLKEFAHEYYHSIGLFKIKLKENRVVIQKQGMGHFFSHKEGGAEKTIRTGTILEESMAVFYENLFFEKFIKPMFNDDVVAEYQAVIDKIKKEYNLIDEEILIQSYSRKEDYGSYVFVKEDKRSRRYCFAIANYLKDKIPNFFQMVEDSRIKDKLTPLARAIEKELGKGSYKMLTEISREEAKEVFEKITKK